MIVEGVDLSRPVDGATFARLEAALHEHTFIVLPGQKLAARDLVAFGRLWGPPEPHVIDTFHHPDDANVLVLSNVVRDGRPTGLADAGSYFHTDYSYLEVPARCTILYALQMPSTPAGTTFADQTRAYEDLPEAMKARIDPLVGRHHYGNRDDLDEGSRTAASYLNDQQKKKDAAALALLDGLKAHATRPKYLHTHDYRVGDVVVWDNAQLLHKAPLPDPREARTLWRVTIKELP